MPADLARSASPCELLADPLPGPPFKVRFASSPLAVRDALRSTLGRLRPLRLSAETESTVEIVLAEVINNIVEHAYAGSVGGTIELQVSHAPGWLICATYDEGRPMPGGALPCPDPPDLSDPPEGGFGWVLIRGMSRDLRYTRRDNRNRLSFRLDLGGGHAAP